VGAPSGMLFLTMVLVERYRVLDQCEGLISRLWGIIVMHFRFGDVLLCIRDRTFDLQAGIFPRVRSG
jgi:hypothetical protein